MPEVYQRPDLPRQETDVLQEIEAQFIQALADENNDRTAGRQPRLAVPHVQRNPDLGRIDFAWPTTKGAPDRRVIVEFQQDVKEKFFGISADVSTGNPFSRGDRLRRLERYRTVAEFLPLDADPEEIIASLKTAIKEAFSLTAQDLTNERVVTIEHL